MGWGYCGKDRDGRDIGYMIRAKCDHKGCKARIDRGLSYVCGGMHGGDTFGCGKYFCADHRECAGGTQLCAECAADYRAHPDYNPETDEIREPTCG